MADILSISSSAVGVYQRVLGVVSNNIANVGNEGYVKQDASVGQTPPTYDGRNFLGSGAMFEGVQRQYNAFIETSLRNANSNLNGQQSQVDYANRVMDVLGSGEIGMSPALDRFFAAARSLAADPASTIARTAVLRESNGVAARFRDLSGQLQQLEAETQQAMKSELGKVNTLAAQLAKVNLELSRNRSLDRQPSTLLDQRDNLLRQLSQHINLQVVEAPNGVVNVSIGGSGSSGALVEGQAAQILEATFDKQSPERLSLLLDPLGRSPTSIAGVGGGSFGGLAGFRSMVLEPALSNLDGLAKTFITEVNRTHTEGVDGYGKAGSALFQIDTNFAFERIRGANPLTVKATVSDLAKFDGKDVRLAFDAQAGQVYSAALLGPFKAGDRFEVTLNGLSKVFTLGGDTSLSGVAAQLRQFIDGTFGVQLRTSIDPQGQVIVSSSVMKSFSLDMRLSSDAARVQLGSSQGLWIATNRAGERITGVNSLDIDGVTVNLTGQSVDGEQLVVRSSSRPAAGIRGVLDDPMKVAAASAFRAVRGVDNLSTVKASVVDEIGLNDPSPAAPILGSRTGLSSNPVVSGSQDWVAQRVIPLATVAAGQRNVAIYLDPRGSVANLQVLTRDGRHLLGTPQADGASFVSAITSLPAPFAPNSTYSAQYLNKFGTDAYRDLSLFYGARALPTTIDKIGTDHVPVATESRPARLAAELALTKGTVAIAAGALTVNGVALPARQATISSVEDVAALINDALSGARTGASATQLTALQDITAGVRDGVLEITRPANAGATGKLGHIEVGFGATGDPQLLGKLGFRSAAYLDGTLPEDLMVFTTGSGDVKVAASFSGSPFAVAERRESLRGNTLRVTFTAADRYRIIDIKTDTVLAERGYTANSKIDYQGLKISFSTAPASGDTYTLDGNQDGRGDNGNALRLAALETKPVAGPGATLSIGQTYLDLLDQIGNVTQQSQVATKALEVIRQQAVEARESVSGVNLDEEAASLIRFQQAYQAAAKSMQVASQMFDAVLRI